MVLLDASKIWDQLVLLFVVLFSIQEIRASIIVGSK